VNDEQSPQKLRPTQVGVLVTTAFLMALMAISFGLGLYTVLHPGDDREWGLIAGISLMVFALLPAGGVWAMWMLWNDLAGREPGSALKKWDKEALKFTNFNPAGANRRTLQVWQVTRTLGISFSAA
jgi:hypothetical protein